MASSVIVGKELPAPGVTARAQRNESHDPLITVRGLAKSYGGSVALDRVDFDVHKGEFLTLLGPSGSGKTTLLGLIAGITLPSEGRIELAGVDISRVPPERRDIGVVFQNYALFPHMTVRDNIAFPLRFRKIDRQERAARILQALELVRLDHLADRYPSELSGGQQQRVALARALIFDPAILLMDEPLSALDKKLREHMKIELREIQQRLNLTIVYVTHDQDEALAMSSRIAVMRDGAIQQIGSPEEIYERPNSRFVADFVGDANLLDFEIVAAQNGMLHLTLAGSEFRVLAGQPLDVAATEAKATVLIRPEHVLFGAAARSLSARFTGRIVSSSYEGNARRFEIDVEGTLLRARTQGLFSDHVPQPGETIDLGWSDHHAHLVDIHAQ
ncbi:ABC transporter ATP-binding protein [Pararhizobium sp.]|uniref:ABC transporter ATP-binding protein n=1 Tax=Pararhizobium sp. TaxID=1977563 RepID=UPI003D0D2566